MKKMILLCLLSVGLMSFVASSLNNFISVTETIELAEKTKMNCGVEMLSYENVSSPCCYAHVYYEGQHAISFMCCFQDNNCACAADKACNYIINAGGRCPAVLLP